MTPQVSHNFKKLTNILYLHYDELKIV